MKKKDIQDSFRNILCAVEFLMGVEYTLGVHRFAKYIKRNTVLSGRRKKKRKKEEGLIWVSAGSMA